MSLSTTLWNIENQRRLVRRIQVDLRKQAEMYRKESNGFAAGDCDGQADALDEVVATLNAAMKMAEALRMLAGMNTAAGATMEGAKR